MPADIRLDTITCPKCGEAIPVSEALSHQVIERARSQIRAEAVEQQNALAAKASELRAREEALNGAVEERVRIARLDIAKEADKRARAAVSAELEDLRKETEEKARLLKTAQDAELALRQQKRAIEERERALELEVSRQLDEAVRKAEAATATRLQEEYGRRDADKQKRLDEALQSREARERELAAKEEALERTIEDRLRMAQQELLKQAEEATRNRFATEIEDARRQSDEKQKLLDQARDAELQLRQEKRDLEERGKALSLEVARRLDEEARKVEEATAKRLEEEHRLRDAEKDKKLQDAQRNIEEMRRRLQQGSQQSQGEVLELELETLLRTTFPSDQVAPVPKGVNGADVVQKVMSASGQPCGTIIWEAKRTKNWSDAWLQKVKDDQRSLKAELAVIVSEALPKDCHNFSRVQGVWVTNPQCALNLAGALRFQLHEVARAKSAAVGKNEKMEVLYAYLSGAEFRQRVEAIVESFNEMQKELQEERRATMRRWAKREKLLERMIGSTAGMYGDFQGLIGASLPAIPALSDDADGVDDEEPIILTRAPLAGAQPQQAWSAGEDDLDDDVQADDVAREQENFSLADFNRSRSRA